MKKKKTIIFFIFLFFLIGSVCYKNISSNIFENSAMKYKDYMENLTVVNKESTTITDKYGKSTCDRYYKDYKDTDFIIIKPFDLDYPLYLKNGCANGIEDFKEDKKSLGEICDLEEKRIGNNKAAYNIKKYNENCSKILGRAEIKEGSCSSTDGVNAISVNEGENNYNMYYEFKEGNAVFYSNEDCGTPLGLPYIIEKASNKSEVCNSLKNMYSQGYLDIYDMNTYKEKCSDYGLPEIKSCSSSNGIHVGTQGERVDLDVYHKQCDDNCSSKDGVTQIYVIPSSGDEYNLSYKFSENSANFYKNSDCSQPYSLVDVITQSKNKDSICGELLILYKTGYLDNSDMNTYKKYCDSNVSSIEIASCSSSPFYTSKNGYRTSKTIYDQQCNSATITFFQKEGYGIEILSDSSSKYIVNDFTSSLSTSITKGSNVEVTLPNISNFEIIGYGPFAYWSLKEDCSTEDINKTTTSKMFNINDNLKYYACFKKDASIINTNYKNDKIYKSCTNANSQQSTLTSQKTIQKNYNEATTNKDNFVYNEFCPITCVETLRVTYPSTFETIKSGTYFSLLYNPQIVGKRVCETNIKYDEWKNTYIQTRTIESRYKYNLSSFNSKSIESYPCCDFTYENGNKICTSDLYYEYYYGYTDPENSDSIEKITSGPNVCGSVTSFGEGPKIFYKGKSSEFANKRDNLENKLENCNTSLDVVNKNDFYEIDPTINFSYQGSSDNETTVKMHRTEYKAESENKDKTEKVNANINGTPDIFGEIYGVASYSATHLKSYKRTVIRSFEFSPENTYVIDYSDNNDGKFVKQDSCEGNSNCIFLGNVYPILLNISGKQNVSFDLSGTVSHTIGGFNTFNSNDFGEYSCSYQVTNDIVIKDNKNDYKINFYSRSISTANVDPNNRFDNGTLGENWASDKGQKLMKQIEEQSKNKNTYNPNNLEYSFVITPRIIEQIRNYNIVKEYKYNDSLTDCNIKELGLECKSDFLTNFVEYSKINGTLIDNSLSMNMQDLKRIRNQWKYFIRGSWAITSNVDNNKKMTKDKYEELFKEEGVLP